MGIGCTGNFSKYSLLACNAVFAIVGIAVLAVGGWMTCDQASVLSQLKLTPPSDGNVISLAAYILIGTGVFVTLISGLGLAGVLCKSRLVLIIYSGLVALIFLWQIIFIIICAVKTKAVTDTLKEFFLQDLKDHYDPPTDKSVTTGNWSYFQSEYKCCGLNNYTDFASYTLSPEVRDSTPSDAKARQVIPVSCCVLQNDMTPVDADCIFKPTANNSYFEDGCFDKIQSGSFQWVDYR